MFTGMRHVYFGSDKTAFVDSFKDVIQFYRKWGHTPKILRADNDTVIQSRLMTDLLTEYKMEATYSTPYQHYQNPVEREVQTMQKAVSTMLHAQPWLQADMWHTAVAHWANVANHTPNVHHKFKSPFQQVTNSTTNLDTSFKFAFGDLVSVGIPPELRDWKFDLRNDIGIYVGAPLDGVSHYIYYPDDAQVKHRGSAVKIEMDEAILLRYYQRRKDMLESRTKPTLRETLADIRATEADPSVLRDFFKCDPADVQHTLEECSDRLSVPLELDAEAFLQDEKSARARLRKRPTTEIPAEKDLSIASRSISTDFPTLDGHTTRVTARI
jgi:hypothetical protein